MSEAIIKIKDMNKWFGDFQVLKDINLEVEKNKKIVVCGPSGSGKSTLIRCINRLEEHQKGSIVVDGIELTEETKNIEQIRAEVGMVFQQFNLFPHLSILDNCTLAPIWVKKMPKKEAEELALKHLERVQILDQAQKYPGQLSGGQQQRIALARAMAPKPSLLLMDEPFSSLDVELREQLAREVRLILKHENISALLVTHDQNEAFTMGDDICVLNQGRVQQTDSAYNLYHNPRNRFVAEFIGEGSIFSGVVISKDTIETDLGKIKGVLPESLKKMANVEVLIRPENVVLSDMNEIQAVVKARYFRGSGFLYNLKTINGHEIFSLITGQDKLSLDQVVGLRLKIEKPIVFNTSSGALN